MRKDPNEKIVSVTIEKAESIIAELKSKGITTVSGVISSDGKTLWTFFDVPYDETK